MHGRSLAAASLGFDGLVTGAAGGRAAPSMTPGEGEV